MSKSGIYAINATSGTALANGATYAPTQLVRRYGPNVQLSDNGISINGVGYYNVSANVSVVGTVATTEVTASLYLDGTAIPGATGTATLTAIGDIATIPLNAMVRLTPCSPNGKITVVVSGQATTSNNLAIEVEKL